MAKSNVRYLLAGFIPFVIWGCFSIPLRNIKGFPSEEILYYRIFTSLILLWIAILLFRKKQLKTDIAYVKAVSKKQKATYMWQILVATVFLVLNWYTFIYAVNNVSLTSGAFAYMVCPLLTAFGGFVILKEQLSTLKLISLVVALISVVFLATGSLRDVIWSVIIAAFYAGYLVIQRKMQGIDKLNVLAVQFLVACSILLPFYIYQFRGVPQSGWFWMHILIIAVVFTIIPLFLSLYSLIGIPSSTLGILIYINPIIAFAIAVLYFGESINANQLYSYLLLLFSVVLFNWNLIKEMFNVKIVNA
ncbi:chloramphenicol-sensitive protein RarD [Pedobacter cryoconitis]|uniref:Chloramphenicol-sensitive protein RarD n=1 Tax=Pedobacter cryoconitis TaxID=188932 RepID=A0A7W8ZKQ9_9SPHI|nr:EamA family transporter [Pedobacter cryoconitis]MBB5635660.1 chloramphenicol-sensitive protein RarD [Pedobacter cryoconitis]